MPGSNVTARVTPAASSGRRSRCRRMKYMNAVPVIATADVSSTLAYYTRILGFKEHFIFGDPPVYAGVERDGVLLYITLDARLAAALAGSNLHPDIFLWVKDVDKVFEEHQRLREDHRADRESTLGCAAVRGRRPGRLLPQDRGASRRRRDQGLHLGHRSLIRSVSSSASTAACRLCQVLRLRLPRRHPQPGHGR